ncbi:hypothetical protein H4R35_006125 [Dimargaris xerosporica]|nr:hypothetical protein H4R35_006125 [Dimargaris xerosporica]
MSWPLRSMLVAACRDHGVTAKRIIRTQPHFQSSCGTRQQAYLHSFSIRQTCPAHPCLSTSAWRGPRLTACRWKSHQTPAPAELQANDQQRSLTPQERQALAQLKGKLYLGFTCKVCKHRAHKFISRQAYTEGVVLIQCDSCSNRHLIADNLGWFRDSKVNIEDLMREQGEGIRRAVDTPVELQGVSEWLGAKAQKLMPTPKDPADSS